MSLKCSIVIILVVTSCVTSNGQSAAKFDRNECPAAPRDGGKLRPSQVWPWRAALFSKASKTFFCAGSLITQRFILTNAHCLQFHNQAKLKTVDDIIVFLGKWNLNDTNEENVVQAKVAEVFVPQKWEGFMKNADADIALVKLLDDVTLSSTVWPICLWKSDSKPTDIGIIIVW